MEYLAAKVLAYSLVAVLNCKPRVVIRAREPYKISYKEE